MTTDAIKTIEELLDRVDPRLIDFGKRLLCKIKVFHTSYGDAEQRITPAMNREEANLVSSEVGGGMHMPAIDIDLPCKLIESSTPGHYHLYIDKELTWRQYEALLKIMVNVGIVEEGFLKMARKRKATYLRLPEKPKGADTDRIIPNPRNGGYW